MSTPSENQWHYTDGATSFGPLGSTTIRQLITAGVVAAGFHLRRDGEETWRPLAEVDLDAPPQQLTPPTSPPPPPAPPATPSSFHLSRNGVSTGPFNATDVRGMMSRQEIAATDLVWKEGMAEWLPAGSIPELRLHGAPQSPPSVVTTKGRRNAFQAYFFDVLKQQYAGFKGRASRKQYWMFILFYILTAFCVGFIEGILGLDGTFDTIYSLAMFVPLVAIGVRRMQDTDHNGWWLFCPIVNLVFALTEGTRGPNRHGPDPRMNDR